jgi:hypothetical protein
MIEHRRHRAPVPLLLLIVASLGACTGPGDLIGQLPTPSPGAPVPTPTAPSAPAGTPDHVRTGLWATQINGKSVQMMEVRDGETLVDFPCAHGSITQPLTLDAGGHFAVIGMYTPESGAAPVAEAQPPGPARYTGWTDGQALQLTVSLVDGDVKIGDYSLSFSLVPLPSMPKCM